jgi:hypothetical protein
MDEENIDGLVYEVELAGELGLNPKHLSRVREKHLSTSDWRRIGPKQKVYLTPEGEVKLRIYAECKDKDPQLVSNFQAVRVLDQCPNPAWVTAKLEFPEGGWRKINVAIPRRLTDRLVGKTIKVEVVRDLSGTSYRHEDLATDYSL